MKYKPNGYNPLPEILSIISEDKAALTIANLTIITAAFIKSGIEIENVDETITLLKILAETGAIEIEKHLTEDNNAYYLIKKNYG